MQPRVMLINPPQRYYKSSTDFNVYFPISLLSIAASIRHLSNVEIFDCLIKDFEVTKEGGHIIYGTPFDKIESAIQKFMPDIVGITVPFSAQSEIAIAISQLCRNLDPEITIVLGGPDASVRYQMYLEKGYCDYCISGEGERSFAEFIKSYSSLDDLKVIPGLSYLENGAVRFNSPLFIEDLDSLPLPAYDLIDFSDYLSNKYLYRNRSYLSENSISVITSRGCPYRCVFCSIKLHMGRKFRAHSPKYVIEHLKMLKEQYGVASFHFEDDNISLNSSRFIKILDEIIDQRLNIRWDVPNGIRLDTLSYDILQKIKKSGCQQLRFAIESGNQRVLNEVIKKGSSLEAMFPIIEQAKQLRINLKAFYVIGFPGETIDEMRETIDLALSLFKTHGVFPSLMAATPLIGTELYDICIEEKLINEKDLTDYNFSIATQNFSNPMITTDGFSKDDMRNLFRQYKRKLRLLRMIYYFKNLRMLLPKVIDNPRLILQIFR